jgi:hypothetical protein
MIGGDTVAENPILRLSSTGNSIVATKGTEKWIQSTLKIGLLFGGTPVDLCAVRLKKRKNEDFFDCKRVITLKKDRVCFHTTTYGRKYFGLVYDLRMLIESYINDLKLVELAKTPVKIRKIDGMLME